MQKKNTGNLEFYTPVKKKANKTLSEGKMEKFILRTALNCRKLQAILQDKGKWSLVATQSCRKEWRAPGVSVLGQYKLILKVNILWDLTFGKVNVS